jgi:hypothetical protein
VERPTSVIAIVEARYICRETDVGQLDKQPHNR